MYTCASCGVIACYTGDEEKRPANCPMRQKNIREQFLPEYASEENRKFYVTSSEIEAEGYCEWPRLKETIEFCRQMGYHKVGIAFCKGLQKEARVVERLLKEAGFEVSSVICKTGGISKEEAGIPEEHKIHPGQYEAMCNPLAQAKLLEEEGTEFNIEIGLCVGHDSLFYKASAAPVTTLVAKDRVLANNPCGAIYCADGYFRNRL